MSPLVFCQEIVETPESSTLSTTIPSENQPITTTVLETPILRDSATTTAIPENPQLYVYNRYNRLELTDIGAAEREEMLKFIAEEQQM